MSRRLVPLTLSFSLLVACGGEDRRPAETPSVATATADDDGDPPQMTVRKPRASEAVAPASSPSPQAKPPPIDTDHLITNMDCDALGAVYGKAWLSDKLAPMADRKMTNKQRNLQVSNYEKAAREAAANWRQACESIVGSPYPHGRLKCASRQKTEKDFNACWDGTKTLDD